MKHPDPTDLFSGLPICDVQRLCELRELLIDVHALQPAPVGSQALVQRDGVAWGGEMAVTYGEGRDYIP